MKEPTRLPTRAELQEVLEKLLPPNEEMDNVSASIILERAGIDLDSVTEGVRTHLEKLAAELSARGEEVPQALQDTLEALQPETEDDMAMLSPERMIDGLLSGDLPGSAMETNRAAYAHAFRSRGRELLSEEDLRILEEISLELQARAAAGDE